VRPIVLALILVLGGTSTFVRAQYQSTFVDFSLRAANNSLLLPGRLYVPPAAASEPRPLILFLHGAGESGTDNQAQININIVNLWVEARRRGAFIYAPQTNGGWGSTTYTSRVSTMLDRALDEYNVDWKRMYVTGLSMGGGGVWNMLNRYDDRFAAAVPICAVSPASDFLPDNLLDEAIWAFHARDDGVVPVTTTRNMINTLLNEIGEPLPAYPPLSNRGTEFLFDSQSLDLHYLERPTGGHGIWPYVYAQQPMYNWLFAHALVPEPASMTLTAVLGIAALSRRYKRSRGLVTTQSPHCSTCV
jgi:predicted peptidase